MMWQKSNKKSNLLHNNNAEKLSTNGKKRFNNRKTYFSLEIIFLIFYNLYDFF